MIERSYTGEEIAEIVARQGLPRYPKLALYREKLSRKAKAEPKFRFYCLYGQLLRIVRYADDFVILAGKMGKGFVQRIERELEGRFGLTINREKTAGLTAEGQF